MDAEATQDLKAEYPKSLQVPPVWARWRPICPVATAGSFQGRESGRTGLLEGHSTAGLAVMPAAVLVVADLHPGIGSEAAEALRKWHVAAGQVPPAGPWVGARRRVAHCSDIVPARGTRSTKGLDSASAVRHASPLRLRERLQRARRQGNLEGVDCHRDQRVVAEDAD